MTALTQVVSIAGSQSAFAAQLAKETGRPIAQGHVWKWIRKGQLPFDLCPIAERIAKGEVTCEQLRPDVAWKRDKRGMVVSYSVSVIEAHKSQQAA